MHRVIMFVTFLLCFFVAGCNFQGLFLDESNLQKVADYYYQVGKSEHLSAKDKYKFLSEKSKLRVSKAEWTRLLGAAQDGTKYESVSIVGERNEAGNMYAIVSLVLKANDGVSEKKEILSRTWTLEGGKWRLLSFPLLEEECRKSFQSGDYSASKSKCEELLKLDPYSIFAYEELGFGIARTWSVNNTERSIQDVLRAMLSINPNDTTSLFFAATCSETLQISKRYLQMLEGTATYTNAAYNCALKIDSSEKRIEFLEELPPAPMITVFKLTTIASLAKYGSRKYNWAYFKKIADSEGGYETLKPYFDIDDSAHAADLAGKLGMGFINSGDRANALKWLDYGITRDPNNDNVKELAGALER